MKIVESLAPRLPARFLAAPFVHLGTSVEVDVATFERDEERQGWAGEPRDWAGERDDGGGVATAVWSPPKPTLELEAESSPVDSYEVRVYDSKRRRRLVAAVELVSPSNTDRPDHRRAFATRCAAMLQEGVCVAIVDVVTNRSHNLYAELLEQMGMADPALGKEPPPAFASCCRYSQAGGRSLLRSWAYPLEVGLPLPTLPLWLDEGLAVPLDLETTYEQTCKVLRIA